MLARNPWNLNRMVADYMYDEHTKGEFVTSTMEGCHYLVDWPLKKFRFYASSYATLSWEFRDSSHGDGLTEGLDGGDDGSSSGLCQRRHLGYPGSGPSTPEVKPLLPACFLISFTVVTVLLELFV
jgi:hypothetical protein